MKEKAIKIKLLEFLRETLTFTIRPWLSPAHTCLNSIVVNMIRGKGDEEGGWRRGGGEIDRTSNTKLIKQGIITNSLPDRILNARQRTCITMSLIPFQILNILANHTLCSSTDISHHKFTINFLPPNLKTGEMEKV